MVCTEILAKLSQYWSDSTHGLSPIQRGALIIVLGLLVLGNIVNLILSVNQYQFAHTHPISSISTRGVPQNESPAMLFFVPQDVNVSYSAGCTIIPAGTYWQGNGLPIQPTDHICSDLLQSQVVSVPSGMGPGQAYYHIVLPKVQSLTVFGWCWTILVVDPNAAPRQESNAEDLCNSIQRSMRVASQVPYCINGTSGFWLQLTAFAVEDPQGRVSYTFTQTPSVSMTVDVPTLHGYEYDVAPALVGAMDGTVQIQWETQSYAYSFTDLLASLSAVLNISITICAFLFPIVTRVEARTTRIPCLGANDVVKETALADVDNGEYQAHVSE